MAKKEPAVPPTTSPGDDGVAMNGVFVSVEETVDGNQQITVQAVGSVKATEVPILLEFAVTTSRQQLGLA